MNALSSGYFWAGLLIGVLALYAWNRYQAKNAS